MRWAVGCPVTSVSREPRQKQEEGSNTIGAIKLEQDVRLVHLGLSSMSTTKLRDVVPGVQIHGRIHVLEELAARGNLGCEIFILCGLGQPLAWLLLHHNPVSLHRVVRVGVQLADL